MANMEYLSIEKRGESRTLLPYSTQRPGKGRTWAVRAGLLLAAAAVLFVAGVRASSAGAGVADMAEKLTQENQDRNQATSDFSPGSLGFGFGLNMLQEVAEAPKNEETGCYRLNVAVGTAEVGIAAPFRARLYNGAYLGGLLRASAAHGLKVELSNTLAPDTTDASLAAAERHPWNAYRLPNHTNLHVHGMHVSPSAPADDVYTTLNGGEAKTYTYHVSADLPAGLFWYHPHAHGATSLQQGGGMAGPLLLDSALDEVKLGLLPPLASDSVMVLSVFDSAGYTKVSGLTGDAVPLLHPHNEEAGRPGSTLFLAANGQYSPVTRALSQGAHRLRLVNTAVKQAVLLTASVTGTDTDAGEGCSFFLTASDGTPQRHPRKLALTPLDPLLLVPGNRRDVVYQCQCKSCVVTWDSDGRQTGSKKEMRWVGSTTDVDSSGTFLTTLVYDTDADADAQSPSLSAWLGDAPDWSAALSDRLFPAEGLPPPASTDRHFRFVFNQGGSVQRGGETVTSYGVNGEAMPMNASHARQVQLGAVEEWVVSNDHPTATHPFHLHTNHFEIVSSSAPHLSDVDFHVGDWRDSISIGPQQNVTIRWRANDYTGLLMAHCHVSTHSDTGMGMPVRIVETHT